MLVSAATWPSQLCGCGLLASIQDFMPPAWNMQLSESCFFWYSVFIVLYLFVLYWFFCPSQRYFSCTASPCELCVIQDVLTRLTMCVWLWSHESSDVPDAYIFNSFCCFVFFLDILKVVTRIQVAPPNALVQPYSLGMT